MHISDLLPAATSSQRAYTKALQSAHDSNGYFSVEKAIEIYRGGMDVEAVDKILKNNKPGHALEAAKVLKDIHTAKAALAAGDVGPAVAKVRDMSSLNIFNEIVSDTSNPAALEARLAVLPHLKGGINRTGSGDSNRVTAAERYGHEAVKGYSRLNMYEECKKALETFQSEIWTSEANAYVHSYMKGYASGKPEARISGLAAIAIARKNHIRMEPATQKAILKFHPEETERVHTVMDIAEAGTDKTWDVQAHSFDMLLDHVATDGGKPSVSQELAIKSLQKNFLGARHYCGKEETIDRNAKYYATITEELQKGSPHVLKHVFGDGQDTDQFLVQQYWYHIDEQKKLEALGMPESKVNPVTLKTLLPSSLKGEGPAAARNHFATSHINEIAHHYVVKEMDVFSSNNKSFTDKAREVALFSRDVLMDDQASAKAKTTAEANLQRMIQLESRKAENDMAIVAQFKEGKQDYATKNAVIDAAIIRADRNGYGLAALDILKIEDTKELNGVAARIEQNFAQPVFKMNQEKFNLS